MCIRDSHQSVAKCSRFSWPPEYGFQGLPRHRESDQPPHGPVRVRPCSCHLLVGIAAESTSAVWSCVNLTLTSTTCQAKVDKRSPSLANNERAAGAPSCPCFSCLQTRIYSVGRQANSSKSPQDPRTQKALHGPQGTLLQTRRAGRLQSCRRGFDPNSFRHRASSLILLRSLVELHQQWRHSIN